ncbi:hypothetical protein B484DRAFT_144933 [Ochromonadaceae sp. CCMP2298]|nr:hypothetical protein B484DRAFT_144933 [Ochromonadaceae sp. CCMP2298]
MDSRHRFSQSKDPFAQSVLFGSGNSPQIAPSVSPSHQTMSPMQSMDGVSTVRSPYQGRRFGSDSGQKSTYLAGTRSHTKRPPLSSVLDERMTSAEFPLISSARLERGLLAPIGGIGTGGIGGGGGVGTPSSSTPMGSTSMGGGLGSVSGGGIGMSGRGLNGAQGGLNGLSGGMNGSGGGGGGTAERELFMSPAPERGSYGGASFFHTQR